MERTKTKVQPVVPASGVPNSMWGESDNKALQSLLDPLRRPPKREWFGFLGSEARGLLCSPKEWKKE